MNNNPDRHDQASETASADSILINKNPDSNQPEMLPEKMPSLKKELSHKRLLKKIAKLREQHYRSKLKKEKNPFNKKQLRTNVYDPFHDFMQSAREDIFAKQPKRWWIGAYHWLYKFLKKACQDNDDIATYQIQDFILQNLPIFMENLANEMIVTLPEDDKQQEIFIAHRALEAMKQISQQIDHKRLTENNDITLSELSLDQLISLKPDRFAVRTDQKTNQQFFQIYSPAKKTWYDYPLPDHDNIYHKGGFGRTILKIITDGPNSTIEAELPPNDFDYLIINEEKYFDEAIRLGADAAGIEKFDKFNFPRIMCSRDLDLNCAFVGRKEIVFCQKAFQSAKTGKISILSSKRDIYGTEKFIYEGTELLKNRGMMRLIKTVVEGKALSFDFKPLNRQIDLGIYWLVLARRFCEKKNFPQLMDRLYYLTKKMGQVRDEDSDIIAIMDRVHLDYSFYDFKSPPLDDIGVTMWLSKKFFKQVEREFRHHYYIPLDLELNRIPGDEQPEEININDYQPDQDHIQKINRLWPKFLERCQARNIQAEKNDK